MKNHELQTIFTTTHPAQAEIVRTALESAGIAAFVDGAHQAGLTGVLDVHVSVAQDDAARAAMLVDELEHGNVPEESLGEEVMDEDAS